MSDFVLVHGGNLTCEAWNELSNGSYFYTHDGKMWGRVWDSIIPALIVHNHRVYCPDLTDENSSTLTGHIEQISSLITHNDLREVILIGHSYGGMVITGVADKMRDRISHLIFVDAALPDPGQSLFDIIASGGCDPLSFTGLEPASPYVEKLYFEAETLKQIPKTYILCTKSIFTSVTKIASQKIKNDANGWNYFELPSSHVPMAGMPKELAQLLIETTKK